MDDLVEKQFIELRKKCPYLYRERNRHGFIIKGTIFIEGDDIRDSYEVEIDVSKSYPTQIPSVKEIGGKIPKDYHHNQGTLCLETPFAVWRIFHKEETLLNFVENLVVPYLYSYSCFKVKGKLPSGEHSHGAKGVLEEYKHHFSTSDDIVAFKLLRILAEENYRGHLPCPCGSQKNLRNCHGQYIFSIVTDAKWDSYDFMKDYVMILYLLKKNNIINDARQYISTKVERAIENIKDNPDEKWGY